MEFSFNCSSMSLQKLPKTTVFQVEMAGYWVQFSTSNNSTSLFDHWLLYRHCAKLNQTASDESLRQIKSYSACVSIAKLSFGFHKKLAKVCKFSHQSSYDKKVHVSDLKTIMKRGKQLLDLHHRRRHLQSKNETRLAIILPG